MARIFVVIIMGAPRMHNISSLCLARHLHHGRKHVHGSNHEVWCCQGCGP